MREVVMTGNPDVPSQIATIKLPYQVLMKDDQGNEGAFFLLMENIMHITDNVTKYTEGGYTYIENIDMGDPLTSSFLTPTVLAGITAVGGEVFYN